MNPARRLLTLIDQWESSSDAANIVIARSGQQGIDDNPVLEANLREAFTAFWELSDWLNKYPEQFPDTDLLLTEVWKYLLAARADWEAWQPDRLNPLARSGLSSFATFLDTSFEFLVFYTAEELRPIREALVEISESVRNVTEVPDKFIRELLSLIGSAIELIDAEHTPTMVVRSRIFEATGAYYSVADQMPKETRDVVEGKFRSIATAWFRDASANFIGGVLAGVAVPMIAG